MPFLAYFAVVGSLLLGLLYFAEARLGPPSTLSISTQFHGVPQPWKAKNSNQILTAKNAPAPELPETTLAKATLQPPLEPPKKIKQAAVQKKKKIAKAAPRRGGQNRFAHSSAGPHHSHGAVW